MKPAILFLIAVAAAWGQPEYRLSQKATDAPYQYILGYSSTNLIYVCRASSQQPTSSPISVASATTANPAVFTISGGHGLSLNSLPQITVSGGTGNWAAVNGTWTATPILSTTLSIPVNSVAFGAVTGTLVFTTRAPLITARVWSVMSLAYDGSSNLVWTGWSTGTSAQNQTCSGAPSAAQ